MFVTGQVLPTRKIRGRPCVVRHTRYDFRRQRDRQQSQAGFPVGRHDSRGDPGSGERGHRARRPDVAKPVDDGRFVDRPGRALRRHPSHGARRSARPRGQRPAARDVQLHRLRALRRRPVGRPGHRQGALRRQFVGRDDRRHLRRPLPRAPQSRGTDELHGLESRCRAKDAVCGHGVVGDGIGRDPAAADTLGRLHVGSHG